MIDPMDMLKLIAAGKPLPQKSVPQVTPEAAEALQEMVPNLLTLVLEAAQDGKDPASELMSKLNELADMYGWYATAGVLSSRFAHWYRPETVPRMGVADNFLGLLRMLPVAAQAESRDDGAWTIPMIILADAGRQDALEFTACAALCASVGHVSAALKGRPEGEGS